MTYHSREKPCTVTRGLPYIIGKEYRRLLRLVRERDHMDRRGLSWTTRRLIEAQCERLYYRVYHTTCYYGGGLS